MPVHQRGRDHTFLLTVSTEDDDELRPRCCWFTVCNTDGRHSLEWPFQELHFSFVTGGRHSVDAHIYT